MDLLNRNVLETKRRKFVVLDRSGWEMLNIWALVEDIRNYFRKD